MKSIISGIFILAIVIHHVPAQDLRVKTNLLYTGATLTPNLGVEMQLNNRITLDLRGAYNPWNLKGDMNNNKKLVHWMIQAEIRYWGYPQRKYVSVHRTGQVRFRNFDRHFFGVHLLASQYNIGQRNLDFLLGNDSRNHRYQGYAIGAGISYGCQWMLSKNWYLEANVGVGVISLDQDKYECRECGKIEGSERRIYFGPTRLGINLVYVIR